MSSKVIKNWAESYLRAALEVDGQKMPGRIFAVREAVATRLKDLEGNSDHHAERHEMQSALAALTCLEDETRIWPTAAARLSEKTVLPRRNNNATEGTTQSLPWKESIGLCPQLPADTRSELGRRVRLRKCEIRDKKNEKTWIRGKKKAAKDAAIFMLVSFVAVLTSIVLMAIFGIWTSAGSILAAVGRKSQSVKEPSDWYRIAGI